MIDDVRADLAPELTAIIMDATHRSSNATTANVGGWKSGTDFLTWKHDAVRDLAAEIKTHVMTAANAPIRWSWAMVNRAGSHHEWHHHDGHTLSGIYYVACGDPAIATEFQIDGAIVECAPKIGRLALFGGSLLHRVPAYDGAAPRITVAFNVQA